MCRSVSLIGRSVLSSLWLSSLWSLSLSSPLVSWFLSLLSLSLCLSWLWSCSRVSRCPCRGCGRCCLRRRSLLASSSSAWSLRSSSSSSSLRSSFAWLWSLLSLSLSLPGLWSCCRRRCCRRRRRCCRCRGVSRCPSRGCGRCCLRRPSLLSSSSSSCSLRSSFA